MIRNTSKELHLLPGTSVFFCFFPYTFPQINLPLCILSSYTLTPSEVYNGGKLIHIVTYPLIFLFLLVIQNYCVEHKSRILKSLYSSVTYLFWKSETSSDLDAYSCFMVKFPVTVSIVFYCVSSSVKIQNTL